MIPVGIAIGRQRQQQDPKPPTVGEKRKVDGQGINIMPPHISPAGGIASTSLDPVAAGSSTSLKALEGRMTPAAPPPGQSAHHATQLAAHAAASAHRWPTPYPHLGAGASTHYPGMPPHPWGLPGASSAGARPNFKPYGPIPMGYQLATDPLTGQILLIPTGRHKENGPVHISNSIFRAHP